MFDIPLQIIDHQQIKKPVVVDVDPNGAHGPERAKFGIGFIQPCLGGDIGERAVAVVVIQRVAVHAGDEHVVVPIVVVVGNSDPHVVARARQTSLVGDVGEVALAVIFEKPIEVFRRRLAAS